MWRGLFVCVAFSIASSGWSQNPKSYHLPRIDLKQTILWDSTCAGADGFVLAFGGQDQRADDPPRTRVQVNGQWRSLDAKPSEVFERSRKLVEEHRALLAELRALAFQGFDPTEESRRLAPLNQRGETLVKQFADQTGSRDRFVSPKAERPLAVQVIERQALQVRLEQALETLDTQPAPRCLSPLAFDKKTGLFVLFGGDHLDYLTNDLWVFDPSTMRWQHRPQAAAPAPRANHQWSTAGDGTAVLKGGYTYTSSTSYCGAQYRDIGDGDWVYDIVADQWTSTNQSKPLPPSRVYRTGPFHPDFFLQGETPNAAATAVMHKSLPENRWVEMKSPKQPELCRTWGHAVLDPDGDRILVFSGGHSAHGGSDVLHYHLATNRWELPFPVEFPLGQLYSNTEYPDGFNLNRRPWVTGHTYQSYNYDPLSKLMVFVGQRNDTYVYDPRRGDWTGRFPRPKAMLYNDAFYTLNLLPTPHGLICWNRSGQLHRLDRDRKQWIEQPTAGEKLPGSVVDASTYVYDATRDRLLFFRTGYNKPYEGDVHEVDRKSGGVKRLTPAGSAKLAGLGYKECDRAVYVPGADIVLFASMLPGDGPRRSLAYDCAGDRWITLAIGYEPGKRRPSAPYGPGHSCGLMIDASRGLIWGVDTHDLRVYALQLNVANADRSPL